MPQHINKPENLLKKHSIFKQAWSTIISIKSESYKSYKQIKWFYAIDL